MKKVTYKYKTSKVNVLNNISFKIRKNKITGIIGESGVGKSTLVDILLGLISDYEGSIWIDSVKINHSYKLNFKGFFGYVPQDIGFIDGTLLENIAFGVNSSKIDYEQVYLSIKLAQLTDLVSSFPKGLKTNIGEGGLKLSGGQRQRLGIARALYLNPSVLILDEATSALDEKTENEILQSIKLLSKTVTIVMVSHKKSAIAICDYVVELKNTSKNVYDEQNLLLF